MGSFIRILIEYNDKIISFSIAVLCLLGAVLVWWQVFSKKGLKTRTSSDLDLSEIEETLEKILKQTNAAIANAPAAAASGSAPGGVSLAGLVDSSGNPIQGVEGVQAELQQRAKIIAELQAQVTAAKADNSSDELLAKIKDLEGKLAEYEIIEDDIADLSLFKEENAKLKKELENIKRSGPEMVDQFADAVAEASAAAVAEEPVEEEPVVASAPAEAPASAPAEASGDIFSEFAEEENTNTEDPLSVLGDIDPDRMLDELKDLNADFELGADSLDEAPDIDKMATEAEDLSKKG